MLSLLIRLVLLPGYLFCAVVAGWAEPQTGNVSLEAISYRPAGEQDECSGIEQPPRQAESAASRFNWKGALGQSGLLLGIQHSLRMVQEKTRAHLDGPFWPDYRNSVAGLSGWNDGNPVITNYVGHPMMGAVTGYIQIQNDPHGLALEWDPRNRAYWMSRFKAFGWATLYSTSYELAPWGEAGIGNVGYDRGTMGYVDLVVNAGERLRHDPARGLPRQEGHSEARTGQEPGKGAASAGDFEPATKHRHPAALQATVTQGYEGAALNQQALAGGTTPAVLFLVQPILVFQIRLPRSVDHCRRPGE
jgi:hypothetical protein